MSLAIVHTRAALGVNAPPITIEVHISNGLPGLTMVGLPETTVKEARDRVRSAIINSGYEFPAKKITINLAPADLPKEGGRYDLPIAVALLAASEQLTASNLEAYELVGELALTGALRRSWRNIKCNGSHQGRQKYYRRNRERGGGWAYQQRRMFYRRSSTNRLRLSGRETRPGKTFSSGYGIVYRNCRSSRCDRSGAG